MNLPSRFGRCCLVALAISLQSFAKADSPPVSPHPAPPAPEHHDAAIPNDSLKLPYLKDVPMVFVSRNTNKAEWDKLTGFWNEDSEQATDPQTGAKAARRVIKIRVPLGLAGGPAIPAENAMTLAKWELGKRLYYDKVLSADNTVSCATCHDPKKGFGDSLKTSTGIKGAVGGMNAPTVLNSAFNRTQFWDGRASSLEEQAQGPVGNSLEMFTGTGDPWEGVIKRLRNNPEYVKNFRLVFGHGPTRDAAAKAIAAYERTVLIGNSIYDRAEVLMRARVTEEESGKFEFQPADFTKAVTNAIAAKDKFALAALGLDADKDAARTAEVGKQLASGRALFFGKARCSNCHVGDNFTDHAFHNLGVGAKENKLPEAAFGRFASLPTGHKDPSQVGAFKTPGLRGLLDTAPYMHDGSEKTLESVIDLYDRGGNANEFLDAKMRDIDAEAAFVRARAEGKEYTGPKPALFTRGGAPIIPFALKLTTTEKADLLLFLKALQGDPVDVSVADPEWFPKSK